MTSEQKYADRSFRSPMGIAGGVLLLAIGGWLVGDAVANGTGRTPWVALAALLFAAPLLIAFTIRPVVYASQTRMLVRNPFRSITIPWAAVETVRAGYSSEVLAGGRKFQLWSVPVSLRARKRAARQAARATAEDPFGRGPRALRLRPDAPLRAPADQAVDDLRELAERHASDEGAKGEVSVRWAYEIIAPAAVGGVALAVLLAAG
ncbi:PH domain-containing protein [Streptantibioticus rubrisoli]|uniref:PH domain-containing protein n=1 Tax=Streptantibioticus rubrisoli TaxID=1387313 RepID=A0ABT1PJH6_9ACTN|nr:PH domain-containing protein [Streptantibioticus rubrisoli]MCQ4045519.1 PH domain-containing protein [Streptantibioticus rubrisoli]